MNRIVSSFCLLILTACLCGPALGQDSEPSPSEPTAAEVLNRALAAMGGETALSKLGTLHRQGTMKVSGYTGIYQAWARAPNNHRSLIDLKVLKVERGFDGKEGWERRGDALSAITGIKLERARRGALLLPLLMYKKSSVPVQMLGKKRVGEANAWVLEFQPKEGVREQFFLDTESFLTLQEMRIRPDENGEPETLTIGYGDYREVDGLQFPFSISRVDGNQEVHLTLTEYELGTDLEENFFRSPALEHAGKPYEVTLSTVPRKVFKESDGLFGAGSTESWLFHLVVDEKYSRELDAKAATLKLYAGETLVETEQLSSAALAARRGKYFTSLAGLKESFDLRFGFTRPVKLGVDRVTLGITLNTPDGEEMELETTVRLLEHQPKTQLSFPLEGHFIVLAGSDFNEPHRQEWSQHFALDILALGPNFELFQGSGDKNEDYVTWGVPILAPADGVVTYARNDIPDNKKPMVVDKDSFADLPDPLWAIGGNCVVIDHGNGEYSFLAHMQHGSVRVKTGESVRRGDVLGMLGNSGNSGAPHLHYHLMANDTLFRSDGLPLRFNNVFFTGVGGNQALKGAMKRGIYFRADWGEKEADDAH